ncbi:MAG TPA: glycosyltransferase family 4 protein [Phenylobacterium sp.]|nr:glycosyltransferase family 4 protein [Phenylobacterium sp.]
MTNAAIYFHTDGFDTSGKRLLGRHSAGESFLRGFLRHAEVDRFHLWNVAARPTADLDQLLARVEPPQRPVRWIAQRGRQDLVDPGVLYIPSPELPAEAWLRRMLGTPRYALCGITHTTATQRVMRIVGDMLVAPLDGYDALICTSTAVRAAVDDQLAMMRDYLGEAYGARRRAEPQRITIPLGVNAADFNLSPQHRQVWRDKLGIPPDALVALYVGRFHIKAKMNPALMAMALERAAVATGRPIYWVNSGWAETEAAADIHHAETAKLCPSVTYLQVDGREADTRFTIWSVADFFISFSDNIQETFGLTPVEAMAAGLPSVVSDWDGYKDTVRDGVDGFRVPTLAPGPGMGGDISYLYANGWISYENYVGGAAQYTAVDLGAAEAAIVALINDPDLRRRQGEQARIRARQVFDWSAIIPQYQALWAEQAERLAHAGEPPASRVNPFAPDPFTLFAAYPSRHLARDDMIALRPGMTEAAAGACLGAALANYSRINPPRPEELSALLAHLTAHGPTPVAILRDLFEPPRRAFVERALFWLARHDVVDIAPRR